MGGYVTFVVAVFLIVIAITTVSSNPQLFPDTSGDPSVQSQSKYCEAVDPAGAPTIQAPADNVTKNNDDPDDDDDDDDGNEVIQENVTAGGREILAFCGKRMKVRQVLGADTTYKLIKKNVPVAESFFTTNECHSNSAESIKADVKGLDASKYKAYYPEISGEIKLKNEVPSRTRGENKDLMYFIDYGLIFAVVLENGQPKIVQGKDNSGADNTFWLADVYKDTNRPEEVPPEAFSCGDAGSQADKTVVVPGQSPSSKNNQLQLEYFLFNKGGVVDGWKDECKPAIYLYPREKTLVNVKISPKGILSYVDPPYDADKGWSVWANPTGRLQTTGYSGQEYPYLYYESKIRDEVIRKPEKGWVVKSSEFVVDRSEWFSPLNNLFREVLPKLGLNPQQTQDFIEYWSKALPYSPYYFVGVMDQENVNSFEPLEITPKPDYINRVRVYFERLENPIEVEAPQLTTNDQRLMTNDFTVVEWGGMVKKDKDHPFTCSQ